jgi:hypothetical protein
MYDIFYFWSTPETRSFFYDAYSWIREGSPREVKDRVRDYWNMNVVKKGYVETLQSSLGDGPRREFSKHHEEFLTLLNYFDYSPESYDQIAARLPSTMLGMRDAWRVLSLDSSQNDAKTHEAIENIREAFGQIASGMLVHFEAAKRHVEPREVRAQFEVLLLCDGIPTADLPLRVGPTLPPQDYWEALIGLMPDDDARSRAIKLHDTLEIFGKKFDRMDSDARADLFKELAGRLKQLFDEFPMPGAGSSFQQQQEGLSLALLRSAAAECARAVVPMPSQDASGVPSGGALGPGGPASLPGDPNGRSLREQLRSLTERERFDEMQRRMEEYLRERTKRNEEQRRRL